MSEENIRSRSQTVIASLGPIVAILGLCVSLAGNFVQFGMLNAKKEELRQSQAKLDSVQKEQQKREEAASNYIRDLQVRIENADSKFRAAAIEVRISTNSQAFARDQFEQQVLRDRIESAQKIQKWVSEERAKLQDKLDSARLLIASQK